MRNDMFRKYSFGTNKEQQIRPDKADLTLYNCSLQLRIHSTVVSNMSHQSPGRQNGNGVSHRGSMRRSYQQQAEGALTPPSSPYAPSSSRLMRQAVRELIHTVADRRSKRSVYDPRGYVTVAPSSASAQGNSTEKSAVDNFLPVDEEMISILASHAGDRAAGSLTGHVTDTIQKEDYGSMGGAAEMNNGTATDKSDSPSSSSAIAVIVQQVSAVAVVALLNMMMAIPFAASYFPIGWKAEGEGATDDGDDESDGIEGVFPLPGKQNIGLRMFLLATFIGQLVYTYTSNFANPVALQMIENVPFMHALAKTVIRRQGYGKEALSTLFFLFGFSSIIVGIVFYALGRLKQGNIVYFFPNHVLIGCIGGIGVFVVFTAIEVTTNTTFDIRNPRTAIQNAIIDRWHLLWVVLALEVSLRCLLNYTKDPITGHPKFQLLSPIFYMLITPIFYIGMQYVFGMSLEEGRDAGYFFPSANSISSTTDDATSSFTDPHMWDVFHVVDLSTISWMAVAESTGTMIALAAFRYVKRTVQFHLFDF